MYIVCAREWKLNSNSIFQMNVTWILWTDDVITVAKHWQLRTSVNFIFAWIPKSAGLPKATFSCTNTFLVLEIETLFAMCCENLSLDQHSCSAKRLRQNLENRPATNAESQGSIYKRQLHAEYCSLILQMKQSKQAGGGTGFPNLSHASDTELLTSALCNHWHCGKAQVTQLQSGIWPGSCLLTGVSAGWFSNLDSISFGSPLVHWGSTCKAITVLKSAVVLERNVL